ncbi:MAG: DUF6879 family protein [Egibacteraceae bacterium]
MTTDEFIRLFSTFERSAFRLETRQQYLVDEEADLVRAFLEGRPPPASTAMDQWLALIRANTDAGKRMERVHILERPLTGYARWELSTYPDNAAAGEQIFIADRAGLKDLHEDFWLFDDRDLVTLRYDEDGRWLGVDLRPESDLDRYRAMRDLALAEAVPLADYLART